MEANNKMQFDRNLNVIEILNTSTVNFDIIKEAKTYTIKKLLGNEMNNFRFYDIPIENDITNSKDEEKSINNANNHINFKSIHRLGGSKIITNDQKNNMIKNMTNNSTQYDSQIRKELKQNSSNSIVLLDEIYHNMNILKEPTERKSLNINEEIDKDAFNLEIDRWEKNTLKPKKEKRMKSQQTIIHNKSKSVSMIKIDKKGNLTEKSQNNKTNTILPSLSPNYIAKQNFEKKYSPSQEELFKKFKNEIYLDETFRKLITRYSKFNMNFNAHEENSDDMRYEDYGYESLEDIQNEIQAFFTIPIEEHSTTILEKSSYLEQIRSKIERKLMNKIRNSEAFINNKQMNAILIRKENGYIIEKMSKIKQLIKETHFFIMNYSSKNSLLEKNKNTSSVDKQKGFRHTVSQNPMMPIFKDHNITVLDSRKASIGKFLEKSVEIINKEKELNALKPNYIKFEEKLNYNQDLLKDLEIDIKKKKNDLKEIVYLRKGFLFSLVKQGLDCGLEEGLSWLVRCCWSLGYEIKLSHLPEFLDSKAKDYIMNKARFEKELKELETMSRISIELYLFNSKKQENSIEDTILKNNSLKTTQNINIYDGDKMIINNQLKDFGTQYKAFSTTNKRSLNDKIYTEMREKLREELIPKSSHMNITQNNSFKIKSPLFLNSNMSDVLENSMSLFENEDSIQNYHSRPEFLKSFEILQNKIQEKKQEILKEEKKEIVRIIKEFDYKQYAKRFSIDCDTVLASLIGAKKANKELIRNGMLKKF